MFMSQPIEKQIHSLLIRKKQTLAVAESCTGGLLSKLLTDISGSSKFFKLGLFTYSNAAKVNLLKIPAALITKNGAVSTQVAQKMAGSVRKLAKTDFGIGITGIAGPSGGSAQKPVGTVFIAISSQNKTISQKFNFTGNRDSIRKKSALKALELLNGLINSAGEFVSAH
jgi:PncC family amidohydrolase